ncbi:NusB antitermination factor [Alicyclobacillus hesperidum URH17-3-68]|nr:NusB antitermination factor [Alicyclobacillus hesperidum URH17-3-68]
MQALYQIDLSDSGVIDAVSFVLEDKSYTDADVDYMTRLVRGVMEHLDEIDGVLAGSMDRWSPERIGRVERNVLRLAVFELLYEPEIPMASAINEAVRLAKRYATEQSGKFVNGVLAKVLPTIARERDVPTEEVSDVEVEPVDGEPS